jgi:hypothetical protein
LKGPCLQGIESALLPRRDLLLTTPDEHHPGASRHSVLTSRLGSHLQPTSIITVELLIIDQQPAAA